MTVKKIIERRGDSEERTGMFFIGENKLFVSGSAHSAGLILKAI